MVFTELILTVSTLQGSVWVLKELILTVSTLGGGGGLEKTDFNTFYFEGCGGLESTDFNSYYFGKVWQS